MTRGGLDPGTHVGPFVIEVLIGQGGMGDVYRALQPSLDRQVALKLLAPTLAAQDEFVGRFLREARTMRNLEHPGIVTIYDAGEADGLLYLAMQLFTGANLKQLMTQGTLDTERSIALLRSLAQAVDYAHSRGIIHRDIKPANILLDDDDRPVLADFGLAKALDDTSTTLSSHYLGTPLYLAPEQASSRSTVGPPADLYALACVAFELLTGSAPYTEEDSLGLLLAHGSKAIPRAAVRNASLPSLVDSVFDRALAKAPTDRYPSARTFTDDLAVALTDHGQPPRIAARARRRRPHIAVVVGAAIVAATAIGAASLTPIFRTADTSVGSTPLTTTTAAPTASTPAAAPPIDVGPAFFTAQFASAGDSFYDAIGRPNNPAAQSVQFDARSLQLSAIMPNSDAGTELNASIHTGYVATMTFSVKPGSQVIFDLGLRWAVPGKLAYLLRTDTTKHTVYLAILKNGQITPLAPPATIPDMDTGRAIRTAVKVDGSAITLWLDGQQVASINDTQVAETAGTIPGLDVYGDPGSGTVRISELVYYNLARG